MTAEGDLHLSEISLNGGMHGAQLAQNELAKMKQAHLMALAQRLSASDPNELAAPVS
jgi:hypothetical protein